MSEDTIGKQVFTGDETWDTNDDSDKDRLANEVLTENEDLLRESREVMMRRGSLSDRDPGVPAYRFSLAFEILQQVAIKASQDNRADKEKFEQLVEEFRSLVEPYGLQPSDLEREAAYSAKLGERTSKLRRLMNEHGDRMNQLTRLVFSGTEAVTEGVSDEEEDGPIGD